MATSKYLFLNSNTYLYRWHGCICFTQMATLCCPPPQRRVEDADARGLRLRALEGGREESSPAAPAAPPPPLSPEAARWAVKASASDPAVAASTQAAPCPQSHPRGPCNDKDRKEVQWFPPVPVVSLSPNGLPQSRTAAIGRKAAASSCAVAVAHAQAARRLLGVASGRWQRPATAPAIHL